MSHTHAEKLALAQARQALRLKHEQTLRTMAEQAGTMAEWRRLSRLASADDPAVQAAQAAFAQAAAAVQTALGDERAARQNVVAALSAWLYPADPAADLNTLPAALPITLLPVRVETRFKPVGSPTELWVRIYPDALHADTHEPWLTQAERAAGEFFWREAWHVDRTDAGKQRQKELPVWRRLLQDFPASRLAWIVEQTEPTNLDERGTAGTAPQFPAPEQIRPHGWTRPARASLLPDRWLVVGYRGEREVLRALSRPVVEPLALSVGPLTGLERGGLTSASDLLSDPDLAWAYDVVQAEQAGMALRIPLSPEDRAGFTRLLVLGVKASLDPAEGGQALAGLLKAHRYTDGLALVPQGTPTNNTAEAPSAYPPPDADGALSYAVERQIVLRPDQPPDHDGHIFTAALGLEPALASHLAGADGVEQRRAADMNAALWPATLGYYLEQLLGPPQRLGQVLPAQGVLSDAEIDRLRAHFVQHVRGRGPYPAFRVGSTPYGLLPVSSLERWAADASPPTAGPALDLLLLQVDRHSQGSRGYLSMGETLGSSGMHQAGWGAPQLLPARFGAQTSGAGMCVADVDGDGSPDLLVVHAESQGGAVQGFYRIGWQLDSSGCVARWGEPQPLGGAFGPWTEAITVAVADLDGDGQPDLLVFHQERAAQGDLKAQAFCRVGRGLRPDGTVGAWEPPWQLPTTPFVSDDPGSTLGVADIDGDGRPELLLLQFGRYGFPLNARSGFYQVGFNLDPSGQPAAWQGPVVLPEPPPGPVLHSALAIADLNQSGRQELLIVTGSRFRLFLAHRFQIADELDGTGQPARWRSTQVLPGANLGTVAVGVGLARLSQGGHVGILRRLRRHWKQAGLNAPHVRRQSQDPDKDLLDVLATEASAREARVRSTLGGDLLLNLYHYRGTQFFAPAGFQSWDWSAWEERRRQALDSVLQLLGFPAWDVSAAKPLWQARLGEIVFDRAAYRFRNPFVFDAALPADRPLPPLVSARGDYPNYIAWLAQLPPGVQGQRVVDTLRFALAHTSMEQPPLLFLVLRHALLLEYDRAALAYLLQRGHITPHQHRQLRREPELAGLRPGVSPAESAWERLGAPAHTGRPLGEYLWSELRTAPEAAELLSYQQLLLRLAGVTASDAPSVAELERLFTETLDVCSHRLDAWITALASRRLDALRTASGSVLGAYGWVEDLRPQAAASVQWETVDGQPAIVPASGGGHIHAPSMAHAAAAAVLRNGYMTRSASAPQRYALELSSRRVREAMWLLDALRQGQPLSALLGYQLERGLHERELEQYIEPLRQRFPLVAPNPHLASQPAAAIAARNVVDGLALQQSSDPFAGLTTSGDDKQQLQGLVDRLTGLLDGVADLMLGEAVYQAVRGNTAASVATLDAMAQGLRPPEPEVARAPRSGSSLTHRVIVALAPPVAPTPDGWPAQPTPRAAAEPSLDRWVAQQLGDPRQVRCRVAVLAPAAGDPEQLQPLQDVTLADLGLHPLDLLALSALAAQAPAGSELDRRVAYAALSQPDAPRGATWQSVRIVYAPDPSWDRGTVRSFPELLEQARAIQAALGSARALAPADLLLPEQAALGARAEWQGEQTDQRATAARAALANTIESLISANATLASSLAAYQSQPGSSLPNPQPLRVALLAAAMFGLAEGLPDSASNPMVDSGQPEWEQERARQRTVELAEALLAQAGRVQRELERRKAEAAAIAVPNTQDAAWARAAGQVMRAVFGADLLFLPAFKLERPSADELALSLVDPPRIEAATSGQRHNRIRLWLQGAARVRPALERWRRLELYAGALGAGQAPFDVLQLPYKAGERWAALPFADESERPPSGRLSIALQRPDQLAAAGLWRGLMIDEWPEVIPGRSEQTGIAFHYDRPGAEPPHAVLLAVSPQPQGRWKLDDLIAAVNEGLDLARVRSADAELLGALGQWLPALFVADNTGDDLAQQRESDAVSTNLGAWRERD